MPRVQPPPGYFTATEAIEALSVTESMFYNFVRNGTLNRTILPGRKQGFYLKEQVNTLAQEIKRYYPQSSAK